jgi:hypothetical protein
LFARLLPESLEGAEEGLMSEGKRLRVGAFQLFMAGATFGLAVAAVANGGPSVVIIIGILSPLQGLLGWQNITQGRP